MTVDTITHNAVAQASLPDRLDYAKALAHAGLLPDAFRQQPANILIGIELATALDMAPIVVINELAVIGGKPSFSAKFMRALVRRAGHKLRERFEGGTARCIIIRADDPDYEHVAEWDEAKARDHGYWGKGHWQKNPALMLANRDLSECVRSACPEVLGGVAYTPDEVADFTPAARGETRVQQAPPPSAKPADALPEADADGVALITREQSDELAELMKMEGLTKAKMLEFACDVTGRKLADARGLTEVEAAQVIHALRSTIDDEPVEAEVVEDEALIAEGGAA